MSLTKIIKASVARENSRRALRKPSKNGTGTGEGLTVIGIGRCWCQGALCWFGNGGQHWPEKENGEPHPRFSLAAKQETEMAQPVLDRIDRKDLRAYHKSVQNIVIELVNNRGVRYREIDGSHLLLLAKDREARPFKIAAERPAPVQVKYIEKWAAEYAPEEKPVVPPARTPEAAFKRPPKPDFSAGGRPVAPDVTVTKAEEKPVEKWRPHLQSKTGKETGFETDGKRFRCLLCKERDIEWVTDRITVLGGHMRGHSKERRAMQQVSEIEHTGKHEIDAQAEEDSHKSEPEDRPTPRLDELMAGESTFEEREDLRGAVQQAVALLMSATGMTSDAERVAELEEHARTLVSERNKALAECEVLTTERDNAIKRADEAEARLALLREAFEGLS